MDSVKSQEELYSKTNENFKEKARKECLWQSLAISRKLSVKVYKTWFDLERIYYSKLMQTKSGYAPKEMMERRIWMQDKSKS